MKKKHKVHLNWVKKLNVLRDFLLRRLIDKFIMCFVLSGRVKRLFLKRKYERKNANEWASLKFKKMKYYIKMLHVMIQQKI